MSRLDSIRKNAASRLADLQRKAEDEAKPQNKYKEDDRFWQPSTDEQGNGTAVVRFLNEPEGEESPYVMVYNHVFQGPSGKWYIENCRTDLGEDDPVQEEADRLWKFPEGSSERILASKISRKKQFYSYVYIIKDEKKPENNGKVKVLKYGPFIRNMLKDAMFPPEGMEELKVDAYCAVTGQDFMIRIHKEKGRRSYAKSAFVGQKGPVVKDEKKLEAILAQCESLEQFKDPKYFKDYDTLAKQFAKVMGNSPARKAVKEADEMAEDATPAPAKKAAPAAKKAAPKASSDGDDIDAELDAILNSEDEAPF